MVEPLRSLSTTALAGHPSGRFPLRTGFRGHRVSLEPLDPRRHATDLYAAGHDDGATAELWAWLPYGPFATVAAFEGWLGEAAAAADPIFFAIRPHACGRVLGMTALLSIRPRDSVAELGHIWFAPALQRTAAATEALVLLMRHVFDDLGYRRLEWKCNAANTPSRRAAERLGFRFEGIFYRHMIVKGCNRDTAWFSLLVDEWPAVRRALHRWLADDNFDATGAQYRSLAAIRADDPVAGS